VIEETMMNTRRKLLLGGGGAALLLLGGAGAFALAQPHGLAAADLDGDGQITAAEIRTAAQQKFAVADSNKDGKLVGAELPRRGRGGRGHGGHQRGHGDHDSPPSAQPATATNLGQPGQAVLPQQKQRMDANGDGAVTLAEFEQGFRQRFAWADANGDGNVSAVELAAAKAHRDEGHRP
jgi:hypothetical protein